MEKGKFYKGVGGRYYKLLEKGKEVGTGKVLYTLLELYKDDEPVVLSEVQTKVLNLVECPQSEIFLPAKNNEKLIEDITKKIGIGYICPFCGGYLRWESDFMRSEVFGLGGDSENVYVEIVDDVMKYSLVSNENSYRDSNELVDCEDIDEFSSAVLEKESGPMFVKCNDKYYMLNDSVVGYYQCMNCGKRFEISDPLPSEELEYPFYQ